LVVPAQGARWETTVSLRVEDHPDPLVELRRLLGLHDAYALADQADELSGLGRHEEAAALYRRAAELAPESDELRFWAGLGAAQVGDFDAALADVRAAIAIHPGWRDLLARIPPEFAPSAEAVLARLQSGPSG
jgi:tetratricopeptide (TPR) repeat protein